MRKIKDRIDPLGVNRPDLVLSVPSYFSQVERQAVLDAAKIADLNILRLMNEGTAAALNYGFFRKADLTDKPRNVIFTDFGHSKLTITIAAFTKGKLKILASVSDRNLGARKMDYILMDKFGGEFNDKFGADPRKVPKCRLRMLEAIEKLRKILSGNQETNLSIECLLEDEDIVAHITRDTFEEMTAGF
jgi:molecular chaperone DnaK (HSP70)